MKKFDVYANGTFWGTFKARDKDQAIMMAAMEFGTEDVGEEVPSTEGLTAEPHGL